MKIMKNFIWVATTTKASRFPSQWFTSGCTHDISTITWKLL